MVDRFAGPSAETNLPNGAVHGACLTILRERFDIGNGYSADPLTVECDESDGECWKPVGRP